MGPAWLYTPSGRSSTSCTKGWVTSLLHRRTSTDLQRRWVTSPTSHSHSHCCLPDQISTVEGTLNLWTCLPPLCDGVHCSCCCFIPTLLPAAAVFAASSAFPLLPSFSVITLSHGGLPHQSQLLARAAPVPRLNRGTGMAGLRGILATFRAGLFLLFVYLGCIFFSPAAASPRPQPKRRKISPLSHQQSPASSAPKPHKSLSVSLRSYLRYLFSFSRPDRAQQQQPQEQQDAEALLPVVPTCVAAQPQQLHGHLVAGGSDDPVPQGVPSSGSPAARPTGVGNVAASLKRPSFASRDDVFPCVACGEVFSKIHLLDLHQATRHAFSELGDGDSGKNIVQIIFQSGWRGRGKGSSRGDEAGGGPVVHRILKIHNSPKTIARFEEYRESVRSRAASRWAAGRGGGGEERCVADGNERLRFYCATFLCGLGREGNLGTCGSPFCATCGIVRHGFSGKDADGVATHGTGWGAHASLPEELEREFEFMHVRRAMLVCRVVAGRVALGRRGAYAADVDDEECDSAVVPGRGGGGGAWAAEDVLLVFNPRAVLPCFVIVYSV